VTILTPMRPEQFASFAEECIAAYARDNATAGRWPAADALAQAEAEFARLLPRRLETPNHFIYEIGAEAGGEVVGFLWFAVQEAGDARAGYVYNIRIKPEHRGRGHAKAALDLIEAIALEKGVPAIALHVFSFNGGAVALYRSLGYGITGYNMLKPLRRDAD